MIHPTAIIETDIPNIGKNTKIWAFTHICKNVIIGENCIIGECVYIGPNVIIGNNCYNVLNCSTINASITFLLSLCDTNCNLNKLFELLCFL